MFIDTFLLRRVLGVLLGFAFVATPLAFAYASVSVSIQSLSPSTSISVGTNVSFTVAASGFTNPTYTVSDSVSSSSANSSNINSSGYFSWTPTTSDVGTHNFTITVNDTQGNAATLQESIVVSAPASISIQSLSPSSSVTSGMTVQFTAVTNGFSNPQYTVSDGFSGSSVSNTSINSSGYFTWSPGSNQNGVHNITVTATDSLGHVANAITSITVSSAPTVVIQSLLPSQNVTVGQTVTFYASPSGFSNPTYILNDSFGGSTLTSSNINSSGYFSWSPSTNDTGTHTITVTVVDSSGHTSTASQTITVSGAGAVVQGLSPSSTVAVGQTVTFTIAASGFTNPVFTTQDSFSGSSVSNATINSAGYFSWTPVNNDVGTHNFTIYINDSQGHTGKVTLYINVQTPNITITSVNPSSVVVLNTPLYFTVISAGFTNPTYTVADSFSGTSITNPNINSSGNFTWTPTSNQIGSHTITVYATDSMGHSANTSITINVNSGISVTLSAVSPGATVTVGATATLSVYTYGFTTPTYTVSDSFSGTSVSNSNINSSGYFTWIPRTTDAGTHVITITATDVYGHSSSAQTTIAVLGSGGTTTMASTNVLGGYVFTSYLTQGMTSDEVKQLQTVLTKLGFFTGSITGYYGTITTAAVKQYQQSQGIDALGVVGPQTRAILNGQVSKTTAVASTSISTTSDGFTFNNFIGLSYSGTDVTELQKKLTALGMYTGPITGYYGALTQTAIMRFQGAHGIRQAGYVGPSTRAALNQ